MKKVLTILAAVCAGIATADTHYLFSGFFDGTSIVAIEFDDVKSSLNLVNNITINADSSKWISIDVSSIPVTFKTLTLTEFIGEER